jgi:hypothetical protein
VIRPIEFDRADRTILILAGAAALGVGVVAAATTPLVPAAALVGLLLLTLIWRRPIAGVGLFVVIVGGLPFGVIPVSLAGAQLTFVDAVLIATFVGVLARVAFSVWRIPLGGPGVALIIFVLVALGAFLYGASVSPITPEQIRRVGKLLVSVLFFLIAGSLLIDANHLAKLTRWLMLAGALQGTIAAGLAALPPLTQLTLLTRLQVIGYPTTEVLRYVPGANNTYTSQLRAVGTSVDPNVLGGTLMLALVLIVVQWASPRPVLRRSVLALLALPTAAGVLSSLSRASWTGLAAGLLLVGVLKYRRILALAPVVGLAVLVSPLGQAFILRFISGFSRADPATAFRFGEYTNALTLLGRYPLLGIGFGASPDIDVSAGVSSVYLLVGEQTGLLGLSVYVLALATTWRAGVRALQSVGDERLDGMRMAFLAAFTAALVTGLLDHYFANQAFPHAVALFWLYAAALVSAARLRQGKPERAPAAWPAALRAHRAAV